MKSVMVDPNDIALTLTLLGKANEERDASNQIRETCDKELEKAEPLVEQAIKALDVLSKEAIGELKGFNNPPAGIPDIVECVIFLISAEGKLAKDTTLKHGKKIMANPKEFVAMLKAYDLNNIPRENVAAVKNNAAFKKGIDPKVIGKKSLAAGGLATWVVNIIAYDDVYQMIVPMRQSLVEATTRLEKAEEAVEVVTARVNKLQAQSPTTTFVPFPLP